MLYQHKAVRLLIVNYDYDQILRCKNVGQDA